MAFLIFFFNYSFFGLLAAGELGPSWACCRKRRGKMNARKINGNKKKTRPSPAKGGFGLLLG